MQETNLEGSRRIPVGIAVWLLGSAAWLVFVYAHAYPNLGGFFRTAQFPSWPRFSPNIAWIAPPALLAFLAIAYGCGRRLLGLLQIRWHSEMEADLLSVPLGLYLLALANFGLAATHLLVRPAMLAVLALALLAGVKSIAGGCSRLVAHFRRSARIHPVPLLQGTAAALMVVFALLGLAVALAPETSTDALHLHLHVVAYYLAKSGFADIPGYGFTHVPEAAHLIFAPLYDLLGDCGPRTLAWMEGLWVAAMVGWIGARLGGPRAGVLAALFMASTPAFLSSSVVAHTDLPLTMLAVAGLWVALQHGRDAGGGVLSGALLGAAAATKYSGIAYTLAGAALTGLAAARADGNRLRAALGAGLRVCAVAALASAPFFLRNWQATGNPLFPATVFPSRILTPEEQRRIMAAFYGQWGMGRDLRALRLLPWNMTVHGERFGGALGGWFLAAAPLLPAAITQGPLRRLLLAACLCFAVFAVGQHVQRYFFPALALLSVAIACSLEQLSRGRRVERIGAAAFTAVALITAVIHLPFFHRSWLRDWFYYEPREIPLAAAAGGESRDAYRSRIVPTYPLIRRLRAAAAPNARVLVVPPWMGEAELSWFPGRFVAGFPAERALAAVEEAQAQGSSAVLASLRDRGITHVLVRRDQPHAQAFSEDSAFSAAWLERVDSTWSVALYQVRPHLGPRVAADLLSRFSAARVEPAGTGEPPARLFSFSRAGQEPRLTLTVLAGGRITFRLAVPAGHPWFEAHLAMPWAAGDGAVARLEFVEDGRPTGLLDLPLEPRSDRDPGWVPVHLDLRPLAGRSGDLVFSTTPGPSGDVTGDWVGWADPRVMEEPDRPRAQSR